MTDKRSKFLYALGAAALLALVAWLLLVFLPPKLIAGYSFESSDARAAAENRARLALVGFLGVIFTAAGLYFTGRNYWANERTNRISRFNEALSHLSSSNSLLRIAGIHVVQEMVEHFEQERPLAIRILSGFIREHGNSEESQNLRGSNEVQEVYEALSFVRRAHQLGVPTYLIDLSGAHLPSVDLSGLILRQARLVGTDFIDCDFKRSDLSHCNLTDAELQHADFDFAILSNAVLRRAHLKNASIKSADLRGAILDFAELQGAKLSGYPRYWFRFTSLTGSLLDNASLVGVRMQRAYCQNASFKETNLKDARLERTDFLGADLSDARLECARLDRANLVHASFSNANLSGARLRRAILRKCNLKDANLNRADLRCSILTHL